MKRTKPEAVVEMLERLGQACRSVRTLKGKRQSDIADATGLSTNVIFNLESGKGVSASSLLVYLKELGAADQFISVLENLGAADDDTVVRVTRGRKPKKETKPRPTVKNTVDPKPQSFDELFVSDELLSASSTDPVHLPDTVKDTAILKAIQAHPDQVFRVSRDTMLELTKSDDYAVMSKSVTYITSGASTRQREVYFATAFGHAVESKFVWMVNDFTRDPDKSIVAIIKTDDLGEHVETVKEHRADLLHHMRTAFGEMGIFVDRVSIRSEAAKTYLKKGQREVKGARYQSIFISELNTWLDKTIGPVNYDE